MFVWLAGLRWNRDVVNVWSLTCTGTNTLLNSHTRAQAFQSEAESLLFTHVSLWAAQEKLYETLCLLQRSARLRSDLKWTHLSTSWPDLTWMSHSLVSGPRGPLFFAFPFQHALIIALASRHEQQYGSGFGVFVCTQKCTDARMWKAGKVICVLIFFTVLPWSSRSWSWIISQMVTSDLLKIWPITANFHSLLLF